MDDKWAARMTAAEVTRFMPKPPTTDQIMTALLTGQPARERRRFETPTRQVHREWGKREQQREARALAEEWWQALRRWELKPGEEITAYYGNPKPSGMRLVGIAMGSAVGNSYTTNVEMVALPCGLREASKVGQLCAANPHLAELYRGAGLATLLHSNGRGWASQRARECGQAVLALASALGGDTQHLVFVAD